MKTLEQMQTVAMTVHFVHQAEIAQMWRDIEDAYAFCNDPDKQQYNPQLFVWIADFNVWALQDALPEF